MKIRYLRFLRKALFCSFLALATLRLEAQPVDIVDVWEPNDTADKAAVADPGFSSKGSAIIIDALLEKDGKDYYELGFSETLGQWLCVWIEDWTGGEEGSEFDTTLEVFDGDVSTSLGYNDDIDGGLDIRQSGLIGLSASANTAPLISVKGYSAEDHGPYLLNVIGQIKGLPDHIEGSADNDTPANIENVGQAPRIVGEISPAGDLDWFLFDQPAFYGEDFLVALQTLEEETDLAFEVFDSQGSRIFGRSLDGGAGRNDFLRISKVTNKSGAKKIRVYSPNGGIGGYNLFAGGGLMAAGPNYKYSNMVYAQTQIVAIPDAHPAPASAESTMSIIPEFGGIIKDLNVYLHIYRTGDIADLTFELTHEASGKKVTLYDQNCAQAAYGQIAAVFDDEGISQSDPETCPPVYHRYPIKPHDPGAEPLSSFDGLELSGNWVLKVTDSVQGGQTGHLDAWGLEPTVYVEGPPQLAGAGNNSPGNIYINWFNENLAPKAFTAFAYDIYDARFTPYGFNDGIFYYFAPSVTNGNVDVKNTGGYHVWISNSYDTAWEVDTTHPKSLIVYSGKPHKPTGAQAVDNGGKNVRLSWKPDLYGTWLYWIIAQDVKTGAYLDISGPRSNSDQWHWVDYGQSAYLAGRADYFAGWADFTFSTAGNYRFWISAMAWDASTLGDAAFVELTVGN